MVALKNLKARDIMRTDVVSFSPDTSIESAISTFEDLHISGAPVVDGYGKLVGVLSAFDVARADHVKGARIDTGGGADWSMVEPEGEMADPEDFFIDKDSYSKSVMPSDAVGEWMSPGAVCVSPGDSLRKTCKTMLEGHFHRVCVVEEGKLVGIVTSFDVVRCAAENL